MNTNDHLSLITSFLNSIDIKVLPCDLSDSCFLPGLKLYQNTILVDYDRLKYPGDLLHEAGHIAVTEASLRPLIGTSELISDWPSQGDEIAAMLWSYAALQYLRLPPEVVFHSGGYKADSDWLINEYENGRYHGLPLLVWMGLCNSPENNLEEQMSVFPEMIKWLR